MNDPIIFPSLGLEFDPARGFQIGGFTVYYYAVIIAIGLSLAVAYGLTRGKKFGIRADDIIDGVIWIVPVAIICARAYYVISEWDQYAADPSQIFNIRNGGLAIYGGVIGAGLCVILFSRIKKVSLPAVLDLVALGFLIGQAIGRWGNFINREAFGCYSEGLFAMRVTAGHLHVPDDASSAFLTQVSELLTKAAQGGYTGYIQVHPTFLYESLWNVVGFIGLHIFSKYRQYDGQVALGYVAWYGLGRAIIEGLRMDSLYWGPFRASQLLAVLSCVAAVTVLTVNAFRKHDRANLFVNRLAAREAEKEEIPEEQTEE